MKVDRYGVREGATGSAFVFVFCGLAVAAVWCWSFACGYMAG